MWSIVVSIANAPARFFLPKTCTPPNCSPTPQILEFILIKKRSTHYALQIISKPRLPIVLFSAPGHPFFSILYINVTLIAVTCRWLVTQPGSLTVLVIAKLSIETSSIGIHFKRKRPRFHS